MKNKITKLNSENLLEVSGGMEKDIKSSWAKELGPIDPESGKQEEKSPRAEDINTVEGD